MVVLLVLGSGSFCNATDSPQRRKGRKDTVGEACRVGVSPYRASALRSHRPVLAHTGPAVCVTPALPAAPPLPPVPAAPAAAESAHAAAGGVRVVHDHRAAAAPAAVARFVRAAGLSVAAGPPLARISPPFATMRAKTTITAPPPPPPPPPGWPSRCRAPPTRPRRRPRPAWSRPRPPGPRRRQRRARAPPRRRSPPERHRAGEHEPALAGARLPPCRWPCRCRPSCRRLRRPARGRNGRRAVAPPRPRGAARGAAAGPARASARQDRGAAGEGELLAHVDLKAVRVQRHPGRQGQVGVEHVARQCGVRVEDDVPVAAVAVEVGSRGRARPARRAGLRAQATGDLQQQVEAHALQQRGILERGQPRLLRGIEPRPGLLLLAGPGMRTDSRRIRGEAEGLRSRVAMVTSGTAEGRWWASTVGGCAVARESWMDRRNEMGAGFPRCAGTRVNSRA